jgi:homoserine kinase type II
MAVFTPVSDDDARALLARFDLGSLVSLQGITGGIENTNYFLTTTRGDYVLTLFEVLTQEQLPFYVGLMHHLAQRGIPVPEPQSLCDGTRLTTLHQKPCIIASRLAGECVIAPGPLHCALTGATLARAHLAAQDFPIHQPNLRGFSWWELTLPKVMPFLESAQAELLTATMQEQRRLAMNGAWCELPAGPIHADLFRDNVLFADTLTGPCMGGIIDFYFAGCDTWLFDVAVSVNDWCIDRDSGELIPELTEAWLCAYAQVRPFSQQERALWPSMLRAAALRFWLSRLYDFYLPRPAQSLKPHDPRHFERVLQARHLSDQPPLL